MNGQHAGDMGRGGAGRPPTESGGPAVLASSGLHHEAFFYAGGDDFLTGAVPFLREAIAASEPALVMVDAAKLQRLRGQLGDHDGLISYADMEIVGRNPAHIIPAWREFVDEHASRSPRLRGIGEPVWAGRGPAELDECRLHEALLNVAFADGPDFWLMCPYDSDALHRSVLNGARRTHPVVSRGGERCESIRYCEAEAAAAWQRPLSEPVSDDLSELTFAGVDGVAVVRDLVRDHGRRAGVRRQAVSDLVLAASEAASNSVRHGGGSGRARVWLADGTFVCEVNDRGRVEQPLAGRQRPTRDQIGGRGLWLANQVCRLVQMRTGQAGTTVRLHVDA